MVNHRGHSLSSHIYEGRRGGNQQCVFHSFTICRKILDRWCEGKPRVGAFLGRSLLNDSNSKMLEILKEIHDNTFKNRKCKIEKS